MPGTACCAVLFAARRFGPLTPRTSGPPLRTSRAVTVVRGDVGAGAGAGAYKAAKVMAARSVKGQIKVVVGWSRPRHGPGARYDWCAVTATALLDGVVLLPWTGRDQPGPLARRPETIRHLLGLVADQQVV